MSDPCLLCRLARREEPVSVAYEDESVVVVADLMPVNPGHVFVLPREHVELVGDLSEQLATRLFSVARDAGAALRRSELRCEAVNYWIADGEAAGQEVAHVHLHVLPRFRGDGFHLMKDGGWTRPQPRSTLDAVAGRIREAWT